MLTIKSQLDRMIGQWSMKHNRPITIRELADQLADEGITADFLYRFRAIDLAASGDDTYAIMRLDLRKLQVLCDFFGCTPDQLLLPVKVQLEVWRANLARLEAWQEATRDTE
jgi:hypothetical protein